MEYTMIINGVDFSPYLKQNGVTQYEITRNTKSITTMDGTLYRSAVRKVGLRVPLVGVRDATLARLQAALTSPAAVTYTDKVSGVTEKTFHVSAPTATAAKVEGGNTWWSAISFTMEEQ